MKKLLLALAVCQAVAVGAFAQEEEIVKKVILEDFTGEWCGWCPEGQIVADGLKHAKPTGVLPLGTHNGDPYEISAGAAVDTKLNITSYPGGAIDRKLMTGQARMGTSRTSWPGLVNDRLAEPCYASVGIAKAKYNTATSKYECDVNVTFATVPPNTKNHPINVQFYIVEDSIKTQNQGNYSSSVQSGADPLVDWYHMNVLRTAVGGTWGYTGVVPNTPVVGKTYTKSITFAPDATWDKKHLKVYAFVAYAGPDSNDQNIMNAEEMSLKSFFPTGVNEVNENLSISNVYPNPAKVGDIVKVEYNTVENATVTMNVLNSIGQVVATPYKSADVAGTHTIQFRATDHNLAAGMYIFQITNSKGGVITHKVNLQ